MKKTICAFIVLFLMGCGLEIIQLNETSYPPTHSVELLTKFPDRPYIEIAIMTITDEDYWGTKHMMEDLKKNAIKIGANALVLHGTDNDIRVGGATMAGTDPIFFLVSTTVVKATAIRYK